MNGLKNLGNTCYINSVIQVLAWNNDFLNLFLKKSCELGIEDELIVNTKILFKELLNSLNKNIAPKTFVSNIRSNFKELNNLRQQDASEFLNLFLNYIHERVKIRFLKFNNHCINSSKHVINGVKNWNNTIKHLSPVSKFFNGQFVYFFKCVSCNYKFRNFSPFLSLDLPLVNKEESSLTDLISRYFETNACYKECLNCGSKNTDTEHETTCGIFKFPEYLIINLKRYKNNNTKNYLKIDIDKYIDLSDFAYSVDGFESVKYEINSMICHNGDQTNTGHYFSVIKNQEDDYWSCISDLKTYTIDIKNLNKSLPYILFFKRMKNI